MKEEIIILGVDPGTLVTGYGVIRQMDQAWEPLDFGCICPPRKLKTHERYLIIFEGIDLLIEKYKPQALSVETQFVYKNVQSALKLGMARGAVMIAAARRGLRYLSMLRQKPNRQLLEMEPPVSFKFKEWCRCN